jgi:hypothetical protein
MATTLRPRTPSGWGHFKPSHHHETTAKWGHFKPSEWVQNKTKPP